MALFQQLAISAHHQQMRVQSQQFSRQCKYISDQSHDAHLRSTVYNVCIYLCIEYTCLLKAFKSTLDLGF